MAIIERATLPGQRVLPGTLQDIIERARAAGAVAPALLMVGEVAGRAASAVAEKVSTGTSNA